MHTEMHRQDLIDAPVWHRRPDKQPAVSNLETALTGALHGAPHLAKGDLLGCVDAALNNFSRLSRLQLFRRVVRLFSPLFFDQFHAAPLQYLQIAAVRAEDNKRSPTGVCFESESRFSFVRFSRHVSSNFQLFEGVITTAPS